MRQRDELDLLRSRISILGYGVIAVLGILTAGFWHFQVAQSPFYQEQAEKNRIKEMVEPAPRGKIFDREGRILVNNRPSYNVILIRENSQGRTLEETVAILAPGLGMTVEDLMAIISPRLEQPRYQPIVLKEDIAVPDIAFVKAHKTELSEIEVERQPRRKYVEGSLAAHALGYVGEVAKADLKRDEFKMYKAGDEVGKAGLERTYNATLRGKDGYQRVVVDKSGREKQKLDVLEAVPGNDLFTTLDLDLQRAAENEIGDRVGAVIAIDPRTGEILVLVSKPTFDPNLFATRISSVDWNTLATDPRKPLRNRVIQDMHPPGSVFKIFMAAAGLEAETLNPLDHVNCDGVESFYGTARHCWKAGGHGSTDLYEAIVNSCNIFFYNVGKSLGIDRIASYTMTMGLGRATGVDLPNEIRGIIPSREWKQGYPLFKTAADKKWRDGETIDASIGQGYVTLTPIQATWAMGGLVSGGHLVQPHLVNPDTLNKQGFKGRDLKVENYHVSPNTIAMITQAMWGVVNAGGTGTRAAVPGFDVAGKTGTAQVVGKESYGKGEETEDNAWFVGFAPYRNPEIVVGVFIEHGGHGGSAAAPVAHAVFDTYYKKKTGQFNVGPVAPVAQLQRRP